MTRRVTGIQAINFYIERVNGEITKRFSISLHPLILRPDQRCSKSSRSFQANTNSPISRYSIVSKVSNFKNSLKSCGKRGIAIGHLTVEFEGRKSFQRSQRFIVCHIFVIVIEVNDRKSSQVYFWFVIFMVHRKFDPGGIVKPHAYKKNGLAKLCLPARFMDVKKS